jgi:hypothetical protein
LNAEGIAAQPLLFTTVLKTRSVGAAQFGTVIVSVSAVIVPPKANPLPNRCTVLPIVIPAASRTFPTNVEFAPSVVAHIGAQNTSQADAPFNATVDHAEVPNAPPGLKIYVPAPSRVTVPPQPIFIAPTLE